MANEHQDIKSENVSEVSAVAQAPLQGEKSVTREESVLNRFKIVSDFASLFLRADDEHKLSADLLNQLQSKIPFARVLLLEDSFVQQNVTACGYSEQETQLLVENIKQISQQLAGQFREDSQGVRYIGGEGAKSFGLNTSIFLEAYLVAKIPLEKKVYYLICGTTGEARGAISEEDTYWFTTLALLLGSSFARIQSLLSLRKIIDENSHFVEEKEKLIEERTRALLDALFDAKKFRIVLELADVIVMLVDAAGGRIVYANLLFEKVTGYNREDVIERKTITILNLISLHKQSAMFSPEFDAKVKELGAFRENYICTTADGSERELVLSTSRIEEEGGGSLYVLIGRDVTDERALAQKEKQHLEELEKLNQLMINRELRIIELKQKLAQAV